LLYWYKSTNTDAASKSREETVDGEKCIQVAFDSRYSLYVLYWYKSTNNDAAAKSPSTPAGTHFACFTGICWRMLTYAHVCSHMLTYADVC
jgi:hypothetical protein